MSESRIRKAVIREDLLEITGDFKRAIILNQFIYWSERVSDADKFIEKENEIAKDNGDGERELFYGWIYKSAEELTDEVMLGLSVSQIRKYVNDLVKMGYLSKRNNPKYKWDRTLQYRVNLVNIGKALKEKGYPLSGYKIDIPEDNLSNARPCAINERESENQCAQNCQAIPDITSKTTLKDYNTETTNVSCNSQDIYTSNSDENISMYAGFPKQENPGTEKKSRFIPVDYTEEQLAEHVKPVYWKAIDGYYGHIGDGAEKDTETLTKITVYFHRKFQEKYHSRCRILSDKAYIRIAEKFCDPPLCMEGVYDFDQYAEMIDRYIKTELNKSGNYEGEVIPSLAHFMSDTIRENLYRKTDY